MAKTKSSTSFESIKPAGMSAAEWHDHKVKGLVALVLIILAAFVFFRTDYARQHLGISSPVSMPFSVDDDTTAVVTPHKTPATGFRVISPAAGEKVTANSKLNIKWAGGNGKPVSITLEDPTCTAGKTCLPAYVITKNGSDATGFAWSIPKTLKAGYYNRPVNIKLMSSDGKAATQSITIAPATK